jgi:hypothetical protein
MEAVRVQLLGKVEIFVCRILRSFSTGVKIGFDVHDERGKCLGKCRTDPKIPVANIVHCRT